MARINTGHLNPREQQIMEIIYRRETVTAADLEALLPGGPSNSTVRTLLRILEKKGLVTHVEADGRFVYSATRGKVSAARAALENIVQTFFHGSVEQAFATLLSTRDRDLKPDDLDRLSTMIADAKVRTNAHLKAEETAE